MAPPPLPSLNTQFSTHSFMLQNEPTSAPITSTNYSIPPITNSKFDVWDDPRVPIPRE